MLFSTRSLPGRTPRPTAVARAAASPRNSSGETAAACGILGRCSGGSSPELPNHYQAGKHHQHGRVESAGVLFSTRILPREFLDPIGNAGWWRMRAPEGPKEL